MTLIKSISGIRGTIGGKAGEGLSPADVLEIHCCIYYLVKIGQQEKEIIYCCRK